MPSASLNVPSLVLVLNTTLSAEICVRRRLEHDVAAGGQLAGLDVQLQIVGEELLAGVGAARLALDLDLALQAHAVGVDPLEGELLGVPARHDLRAGRQRQERVRQRRYAQERSNTHDV